MSKTFTICATGHRPNKLQNAYNMKHPINKKIASTMYEQLKAWLTQYDKLHIISGGALGVDTIWALVAIKLRNELGSERVTLEIAVPCQNHSSRWLAESVALYNKILASADLVTLVTNAPYAPRLMQTRNEYMVNKSDYVYAVWDGTSGGTGNCVKYAKQQNKPIIIDNPTKYFN